jgi:hypothetical protein
MPTTKYGRIQESLVAMFAIEAPVHGDRDAQAKLVDRFVQVLSDQLRPLESLGSDSFSTGDGVIISIGRNCHIDQQSTELFLAFVIALMKKVGVLHINVRAVVNYSRGDRLVVGTDNVLPTQYLQVGDTINVAARVLAFCEPRELMVTSGVVDHLENHALGRRFHFRGNPPLMTKDGHRLQTSTFEPPPEFGGAMYSPDSPLHRYKRFTAFPPLTAETLLFFMDSGLDSEVEKVVRGAYDAMSEINETRTFVSASEIITVLTRNNYDPKDTVYVLSRDDKPGFWTQKRRNQYVNFLSGNARACGGLINQTRVWIHSDAEADELEPGGTIFRDLIALHAPGTAFKFSVGLLNQFPRLAELIFGVTVSKLHGYAIIPVPSADLDINGTMPDLVPSTVRPDLIGDLLARYRAYEPGDGPMKAIITADTDYVGELITEFENLLNNNALVSAKLVTRT